MIQASLGIVIAYLITFFLLPFIIKIAHVNKLYDRPDDRKMHGESISSLGGIAMFTGLVLTLLLNSDFDKLNVQMQYYLAAFFILFLIGVIDDIFVLKAWKKILGQIVVTGIITFKAHLLITNLQGFLGIGDLSHTASLILTFFTILLLINAFNLIDGVDGLAASLGFLACLLFGIYFLLTEQTAYVVLSFSMCGALLAFLIYNFPPARIFMGDSGSTLIGLVTAILAIRFVQPATSIPVDLQLHSAPAIAFGFLLIPLLDVLRVFMLRISKRKSPFAPDRTHLHHMLQNKGYSHLRVTLTLLISGIVLASISFGLQFIDINIMLAFQFIIFFVGIIIVKKYLPEQKKLHIVREELMDDDEDFHKVYPIYTPTEKVSAKEE